MKKLLFISNDSKPSEQEYNYIGEEKLTNFSIPIVKACEKIGLKVTIGINKRHASKMTCKYPVDFYNAQIYRNPFNIKEVLQAYKNACNELRNGNYVGIHCNTPIGGVVGRLAGKKCGIKKVLYTAHGFHFYKGAPLVNWLLYFQIERWLAHYTDALITMNHEDFERAQRFHLRNNGKVYYVPGVGINTEEYKSNQIDRTKQRQQLGLNDGDCVCISMGDLIPRKNYKTAIEAIAKCGLKNVHYLICGEGPEKDNLQLYASQCKVSERVHFLGYRNDIKDLLYSADIFLFTSLQEGMPRSMMEAMAAGLPCIASRIRGNVDLLEDGKGGYLIDPHDSESYSYNIKKLANDKQLRTEMAEHNLKRIKLFDTNEVEKRIWEIYNNEFKKA